METLVITCTCDDNCDEPCPAHAREGVLLDELNAYRDAFATVACELDSFWHWLSEPRSAGMTAAQATETLRAIGKVVQDRAFAIAQTNESRESDPELAADVEAFIRESLGLEECKRCGGDEYVQPCNECGGGMPPSQQ